MGGLFWLAGIAVKAVASYGKQVLDECDAEYARRQEKSKSMPHPPYIPSVKSREREWIDLDHPMDDSCTRCGGEGYLSPRSRLPDNGICYRCHGTCKDPDPHGYRDEQARAKVKAEQPVEKEYQEVTRFITDIYLFWVHERTALGLPDNWSTFCTRPTLPPGVSLEVFNYALAIFQSRPGGRLPEKNQISAFDQFQQEQERQRAIESELAEKRKQEVKRKENEHLANLLVEEDRQRALRHLFQIGEVVSHPHYGAGIVLVAHPWHLSDKHGQLVKCMVRRFVASEK